jgi:hypothetical protein
MFRRTVLLLSSVSNSPKRVISFCITHGVTRGRNELSINGIKIAVLAIVVNETKSKLCLDYSRW